MCRYCFEIYNHADLRGPWTGWRLRGRDLISPNGERVNPARLAGLLWCDRLNVRARVCRDGGVVVRLPDRGARSTAALLDPGERRLP